MDKEVVGDMSIEEANEVEALKQDIDKAVDDVVASKKKDLPEKKEETAEAGVPEPEKDNLEVDDSNAGAEVVTEGGKAPKVTDAQIERAVKLGISFADAKNTDPAFLDRVCDAMEAKVPANAEAKDEVVEGAVDEFEIPDLDPEVFDETLAAGWSAMKRLIAQQAEAIKNLSQGKQTSWFDSKLNTLGVDVGDKKDALKSKFDVLAAGYKASGQQVAEDEVFSEASRLVLGDELKAAKEKSDKEDLTKRNKLLVNRPTNHSTTPHKDPLDEVADEIDRKYFGKR